MNLQEQISRIKSMMNLNEQVPVVKLKPDMGTEVSLVNHNVNDTNYTHIATKDNVLMGYIKSEKKWEYISNTNSKYEYYLKLYNDIKNPKTEEGEEDNSPYVDVIDPENNSQVRIHFGQLTKEDINKIYKYSMEYEQADQKFKEQNGKNSVFCAGDVFDISYYGEDENVVRNCGIQSFENITIKKLPNKSSRFKFLIIIKFIVKNPQNPKSIDLKKKLGITL
jgi:hypothetical protein